MPYPSEVIKLLSRFSGSDLTQTLSRIESAVQGVTAENYPTFLVEAGATHDVLAAAASTRKVGYYGHIDQPIHAGE